MPSRWLLGFSDLDQFIARDMYDHSDVGRCDAVNVIKLGDASSKAKQIKS